jgi:hypothetical protein
MTRAQLVRKLLRTLHLNVPERRQLDPPTIDFAELVAVIQEVVERDGRFASGDLSLEKIADGRYRLRRLVPDPSAGDMWADDAIAPITDDYASADPAAELLIRRLLGPTWGSPVGTLDGIRILGCPVIS